MVKKSEVTTYKEKFVIVRVTQDLKERFEEVCKKKSQNQSELLRRWMTNYIERGNPASDPE